MSASAPLPDSSSTRRSTFLTRFIATGFFSGYIPWASGTFGSLLGMLICLVPGVHSPQILLPLVGIGFVVGVHAAGRVAQEEGDRLTRSAAATKAVFHSGTRSHPDPSIVVIDEIVGMWISLLWLSPAFLTYAVAFVAFRLFDVIKPEPARVTEGLPGGWGIMLDDVVAGCYANLATRIVLFLVSTLGATGRAL